MSKYLLMGSYTSDAWAAQVKTPQNRLEAVTPVFEKMGGSVEAAYMAFGDDDLVIIAEFPDNVSAAALSIAVAAGGGVSGLKTIPLISFEDGVNAIKKASQATYKAPGE
tara:strand:+ start:2107 stop:2433 length:327 start_codon:yes stop_codon:yes gene_type:complete